MRILVTGATGQLGRPTAQALRATSQGVRGMSRSGRDGTVVGNLLTGEGLPEAFDGIDTVVHAATGRSKRDIDMAKRLVASARHADVTHLVLMSIVGVDQIPMGYFRDRLTIENIVLSSGLPLTILRATQFHGFIDRVFSAQRRLPVLLAPNWTFQPIDVDEVAMRVADLALIPPAGGRAPDIGGPQRCEMRQLLAAWQHATGDQRRIVMMRPPGKASAAFDAHMNIVPGIPYGRRTFADYLAATYT